VVQGRSKDKGVEFFELVGGVVGGMGRYDVIVTRPCLELDMFSEVEPNLLRTFVQQ
jgi:hypothetical protein